jgi:hypothetical protein
LKNTCINSLPIAEIQNEFFRDDLHISVFLDLTKENSLDAVIEYTEATQRWLAKPRAERRAIERSISGARYQEIVAQRIRDRDARSRHREHHGARDDRRRPHADRNCSHGARARGRSRGACRLVAAAMVMTNIRPIETSYRGYRFRSRLEARLSRPLLSLMVL